MWLWLTPVIALAAAGFLLASGRGAEVRLLAQARQALDMGNAEGAESALTELVRRPLLSERAREAGAELFFRLGEDHAAHALLKGAAPDPRNPRDRRLRELAARCQRAAADLSRADRAPQPDDRLRLARSAERETPEAPRVLERVVDEELLVMSRRESPEVSAAFEQDYARLRLTAPHLATRVKDRVAAAVGERTN